MSFVLYNPINRTDPTGHRECDLDCQEENETVDPVHIHDAKSYEGDCWGAKDCLGHATLWKGNGTAEVGGGGMLSGVGPNYRGDVSFAIDGKGNFASYLELGGGASIGAGYSLGLFYSSSNAPSVSDLQGWSTQAGFSAGTYAVGSLETLKFNSNGQEYRGTTYGGGIRSPIPAEVHWTLTYSTKIFSFNIFDTLIKLFGT